MLEKYKFYSDDGKVNSEELINIINSNQKSKYLLIISRHYSDLEDKMSVDSVKSTFIEVSEIENPIKKEDDKYKISTDDLYEFDIIFKDKDPNNHSVRSVSRINTINEGIAKFLSETKKQGDLESTSVYFLDKIEWEFEIHTLLNNIDK